MAQRLQVIEILMLCVRPRGYKLNIFMAHVGLLSKGDETTLIVCS